MSVYSFHPTIYPRFLWVTKSCDEARKNFAYRNEGELELEDDEGNESICTVFSVKSKATGSYGALVLIRKRMSVGDVAHEAVHVATNIFSDVEAIHEPNNQEPFAYLTGWVAECIYQVMTNKIKNQ